MNVTAYRRSMAAGIAFVGLFVIGVVMYLGNAPEADSSDSASAAARTFVDHLSDSGHRAGLVASAYLLILAALAFIWFTQGLRDRLGGQSSSGRLVAGFGVFGAGALAAAGMCAAGTAGSVAFGGEPVPAGGDAIRAVLDLVFPFIFVVFGLTAAAIVGVVTAAALKGNGWPRWVGWLGVLGTLGALVGVELVPFILPTLWFLAVAIAGVAVEVPLPGQRTGAPDDAVIGTQPGVRA